MLSIGEIGQVIGGGTPSTKIPGFFDGDVGWITPKDLAGLDYRFISEGERSLSFQGLAQSSAKLLPEGAVILSSRAPVGYVAIASEPVATNQGCRSVIPNSGFDSEFIYFMLKANTDYLKQHSSGSTYLELSGSTFKGLEFLVPPLEEQQAIAEILGALDDRIELNRMMNATLDELARTIFRSWFVDFDPVHAKAAGREPFGMDPETAALFPDRFTDSQLGPIPDGWSVDQLGNVLTILETGLRPKGGVKGINSGVPSVGAESIVGIGRFDYSKTKFIPKSFFQAMRRGHAQGGDVLLYKDGGRPGEFEPHVTMIGNGYPFPQFAINEHVYRVRTDDNLPQTYLYCWLSSDVAMEEMRRRGTGVAIPGLNSNAVRSLSVLIPSADSLAAFERMVSILVEAIFVSCNESRTLAQLRDTLLPELISGRIRVPEAEKTVAEVV